MTGSRCSGAFVSVMGGDDLLRPTPMRACVLLVGLVSALTLGFVLGMFLPHRQSTGAAEEGDADVTVAQVPPQ